MTGAVAAGHRLTADAAAEVLRDGGNAFDAAIAGFFTACVCEPVLASLGGGGFLLARDAAGTVKVFDFFTQTPRRKVPANVVDFYPVTVDFGSAQQDFHIGLGACAAPGAVSGMFTLHRELGSVPLRTLIQPAAELARNGVVVDPFQAYLLQLVAPIYSTQSALPLFSSPADRQRLVAGGDVSKNAEAADVMESLAIEGEDLFYRGEIASTIVNICRDRGHLDYDDLREYRTILRQPLCTEYQGRRFYTNPPPSAGGVLISFALNLLNEVALKTMGFGSYPHLRTLAEILRKTSEVRARHFVDGPHAGLLDDELVRLYRQEVDAAAASYKGTTHISVIDKDKNVAALTVSNGEGCGELVPGTGIMLNNMLGEEDLNPAGFHGWEVNQRMSSMMAPSMMLDGRGGVTALGSGGSNRIRTAVLQVVSNLADFDLDLETAVANPRIHLESDVLNMEVTGLDGSAVGGLTRDFPDHRLFEQPNMFFGGVHVVEADARGGVRSFGDPRRSGVGIMV